jgi:hypothetical protein
MAERWIADHILPRFYKMEATGNLERALIRAGWLVKLNRSNITRGWTYNSDMFRIEKTGRFHTEEPKTEITRFIPHGAGSGRNPLLALIDAARLTGVKTPDLLVAILEAETELLTQAHREAVEREEREARQAKIDADLAEALDGLTAVIRSANVPATDQATDEYGRWFNLILKGKPAPAVVIDEDDDL